MLPEKPSLQNEAKGTYTKNLYKACSLVEALWRYAHFLTLEGGGVIACKETLAVSPCEVHRSKLRL